MPIERGLTRWGWSFGPPQVLRLLAQGMSNAAIAKELVISPATVARHVSNTLNKTGLSNRIELATYRASHGLVE